MTEIVVQIEDHSDEVLAALQNAVERWAGAVGQKASTYAKDELGKIKPVRPGVSQDSIDTGALRNSVTYMVVDE